jgi:flavorubredoxin
MPLDMKMLFEEAAVKGMDLKGKLGAAFGSYGWSGEAPKLVIEIMKNKFGMETPEPPLLIRYAPDTVGIREVQGVWKEDFRKTYASLLATFKGGGKSLSSEQKLVDFLKKADYRRK